VAVLEQTHTANRQLQVGRIVLTVLAAPLWLLGWLAGTVALAILWMCAAIKLGWTDSRRR
jgi:hypothetical protein